MKSETEAGKRSDLPHLESEVQEISRTRQIPELPRLPERIVCLTEETVELLYLLGEQHRIAGISVYVVRPERARKEKPMVTSFIKGDVEKIKALNPDLIIGFSDIQADLAQSLIKEGLPVWITNQRSLQQIFDTMLQLGALIGQARETLALLKQWQDKLATVYLRNREKQKVRVFFQEWDEPLIHGIQWVSELIEICGGINCLAEDFENPDVHRAANRITTVERVADSQPDTIIGSWCGKPVDFHWIRHQDGWKETVALQKDLLFEIDASIILQPGPALFMEGIDELERYMDRVRDRL
ncbi:MAG: cobalamin-binding protein [Leptospiraceae bacterium]|nr:cobalamin-binding protein [Leptospiraceae bacterium]MCB1171077.1 cobalamin-binding protein [Leptospiraceae bacterium]